MYAVTHIVLRCIFILRPKNFESVKNKAMNFFVPSFFLISTKRIHLYSCQIPELHRGKKVLATIRDPMDYYISIYINNGMTRHANFEKFLYCINSDRFLKTKSLKQMEVALQSSIGYLTYLYIQYFFKNAAEVFSKNDEELNSYFKSGEYKKDMYDVTFLNTKNLNKELRDFLFNEEKISPKYIDFILSHPNVETTSPVGVQTYNYKYKHQVESLRNELTAYIKDKDRFYCRYFLTTSLD